MRVFTQSSAFSPVIELICRGLGIEHENAPEEKLERLANALERAGLSTGEAVPLIAPLLSISLPSAYPRLQFSTELLRKKTIDVLVAWVLALADEQPLVLAVEDVHWCDPSTIEFLGALFEQCPTASLLVLATYRLEFEAPWPRRMQISQITLPRLRPRHAEDLIRAVAQERALSPAAVQSIVGRGDGVPLFLEELTKAVVETSGEETEIPRSLQDSLMARLDRLGAAKEVAQAGSVLGRAFPFALIEAISMLGRDELATDLRRLVEAELLQQRGAPPQATYAFKHALIQDTAYQSMLRTKRRQLHAQTAEALERYFPEQAAAEPETLARHYDYAGLGERAIINYEKASQRSTKQTAYEETIAHLTRALEILETLPDNADRNRKELELQLGIILPQILARGLRDKKLAWRAQRCEELLAALPDTPVLVRFNVWMQLYAYHILPGGPGIENSTRGALKVAEESADARALVAANEVRGAALFLQGHFAKALPYMERAVELYDFEKHGPIAFRAGTDHGIFAMIYRSSCLWMVGYPEQAAQQSETAIAMAKKLDHPFTRAHVHTQALVEHWRCGRLDQAQRCVEDAIRVCEEFGFAPYLAWAEGSLAVLGQNPADLEAAATAIDENIAVMEGLGVYTRVQSLAVYHTDVLLRLGRFDEALRAIQRGFEISEKSKTHFESAELYRLRGECLCGRGDQSAAVEAFGLALKTARQQGSKSLELRAATSFARWSQSRGEAEKARDLLAPVYDWLTEGFDTQDLKDAKALMEELG